MLLPRPALTAATFWVFNVGMHGFMQRLFGQLADRVGFDRLQEVELGVGIAVLALGTVWLGVRGGWRLAGIVATANVLAGLTFVTRAEGIHLVQYALVYMLWARALVPRQAFWLTVGLGGVDEALQWAVLDPTHAGAVVDVRDCVLNFVGALNGWALTAGRPGPKPRTG